MQVEVVSKLEQLALLKPQWDALHRASNCSIFVSYPWIAHHIRKQNHARVIVVTNSDNRLLLAMPLKEGVLSEKVSHVHVLEHLCKSYTDYHEFLATENCDLESVSTVIWEYLEKHYPAFVLRIEFPPPDSFTRKFLSCLSRYFEQMDLGANYVFINDTPHQTIDGKLAKDIERRARRLQENHSLQVDTHAAITKPLLNKVLDLHRQHHGYTSFNGESCRRDILALLDALQGELVCSALYIDGVIAAAALSFRVNDTLFYYAPAVSPVHRHLGVGLILFRRLQQELPGFGCKSINLLRGEEPYKIRLSSTCNAVEGMLLVPLSFGGWKRTPTEIWRSRRNRDIQLARKKLNATLARDNSNGIAIVLAHGLNGLGAVRALAAAGIYVYAFCPRKNDLTALSNSPGIKIVEELDESWEERVFEQLQKISERHQQGIPILACSDRAANFIEAYAARLPGNILTLCPTNDLAQILNDKSKELAFAHGHNIAIPASVWTIESERPFDSLSLPVIIKPRDFNGYKTIGGKNVIASTPEEMDSFYARYQQSLSLFVAQEIVPGGDENLWVCNATFDREHNMVAAFTFRRLGTSPPHYGVTSFGYSQHNTTVKEIVRKLGRAISYIGPGMWEFKYDEKSGEYLYIETNPRLGMCNWFDTQCNVSNVLVTYYLSLGVKVNPLAWQQSTGMYYLNALADPIARVEDREPMGSILARYLRISPASIIWSAWSRDDSRPALMSSIGQINKLFKRTYHLVKRTLSKR